MKRITFPVVLMSVLMPMSAMAELPCESFKDSGAALFGDELMEISGMAVSHNNRKFIWAHVDSDGKPELYLINESGQIMHTYTVDGVVNKDWEDIAVGPCGDKDEKSCIYLGDTGDNLFKRNDKSILVIEEPAIADDIAPNESPDKLTVREKIPFVFPETDQTEAKFINPDCESLMVHPVTADIYIVSKQSNGGAQTLYHVPRGPENARLEPLASYDFISTLGILKPLFNAVTGADFAPDGKRFTVRTYATIYEYDLEQYPSMAEAFLHPVERFGTSELQGEAVAYAADGESLMTSGEGVAGTSASMTVHTCVKASGSDNPGTDDPGKDDPGKDDPGKDDPGTDDPGKDDPGKDDPGKDDPGTDDPGKDDPGTDDPGKDDPGKDDPGKDDPGTDDPGTDDPGTDDPGTDDPGTDDPGTDNPGTDDPGKDDPGTDTPSTDNPGTDDPGKDDPGTDTPSTDNPGTDNPQKNEAHSGSCQATPYGPVQVPVAVLFFGILAALKRRKKQL